MWEADENEMGALGADAVLSTVKSVTQRAADMKSASEALKDPALAKIAALSALKPRIRARRETHDAVQVGKSACAALDSEIMPVMEKITGMLKEAENQRLATSEHAAIMNTRAYRKKVLDDLRRIAVDLPASHARYVARKVGILSGLV